eukprot:GHVT01017549.1.p3 GENE.GHVT01017549.1~~GHVT01017549.1.p3  ORF type:complete len:125 (-),score=35.15 GHVT01017549.1:666-1040(-)
MSESLPLDRALAAPRIVGCVACPETSSEAGASAEPSAAFDYSSMPPTSVIIIFHNEDLSVLLRSLHSVLNRTPPSLLHELVVVDDASDPATHPWLGRQLQEHIARLPKTKLLKLQQRHGLMVGV